MPLTMGGMVEEYRTPMYSTAVGLVLGVADGMSPPSRPPVRTPGAKTEGPRTSGLGAVLRWIKNGFF